MLKETQHSTKPNLCGLQECIVSAQSKIVKSKVGLNWLIFSGMNMVVRTSDNIG